MKPTVKFKDVPSNPRIQRLMEAWDKQYRRNLSIATKKGIRAAQKRRENGY